MRWLRGLSCFILLLSWSFAYAHIPDEQRIELGITRLSNLIRQNEINDKSGVSHLNRHIFSLDECDLEDRIREKGVSFIPDAEVISRMEDFLRELANKGVHLYVALNGEDLVVDELGDVTTNISFSHSDQFAVVNQRVSTILDEIYGRCSISSLGSGKNALLGITPVNWLGVHKNKEKSAQDLLRIFFLRSVRKGPAFPDLLKLITQRAETQPVPLYSAGDRNTAFEKHLKLYASVMENYSSLVSCPVAGQFIEERKSKEPFVSDELIQTVADYLCTYGNDLSKDYNQEAINSLQAWEKKYYFEEASQNDNRTYERYLSALQKRNSWYKQAAEKTFTIRDQENMILLAEWFNNSELRTLTVGQKISMLITIAKGPMNGDWVGKNGEGMALRIMRSIKKEEAEDFLELLIREGYDGEVLLNELFSGIDDFGGADNFTAFINELQRLVFAKNNISTENAPDKTLYRNSAYQFVWNSQSKQILPGQIDYVISRKDERTLSVERKICEKIAEVRETDGITYDRTKIVCDRYLEDAPVSLDYYDLVVIHFIDNPYYLEVCEQTSCADVAFLTFAGYVDYLKAKKNTRDIETAVRATLLTASFAVGVGELGVALRGGQTIRALIATWALSGDVLDVVINTPEFQEWLKAAYPEDWASYQENLQLISLINLGTVVSGDLLYNAVKTQQAARFVATVEVLEQTGGAPAKQMIALRQSARQVAKDMEALGQRQVLEEARGEFRSFRDPFGELESWLTELSVELGGDSKSSLVEWINAGLDWKILNSSFARSVDKRTHFNKLKSAKGVYHRRTIIGDYSNIPGVSIGKFEPNWILDNVEVTRIVDGKTYSLEPTKIRSFKSQVELPKLPSLEVIEDFGGGIQLVRIRPKTKLFRVFDGYQPWDEIERFGSTLPTGSYWTFQEPIQIEDVIVGSAVRPEWNGYVKLIEIEVPEDGLIGWFGITARQPVAEGTSEFFLEGGSAQIVINFKQNSQDVAAIANSIRVTSWTK